MLVQKGQLPNSTRPIWLVLDDSYQPIEPVMAYLRYLDSLEKSPNTVRTYAYNLKLYWEFLQHKSLNWQEVNLEQLADFIHWLRNPQPSGVVSIQPQISNRTEKTINHALNTVSMFYEFHIRLGQVQGVTTHTYQVQPGRKFKPFLHHISKGKEVKTRLLRIKEPKTFPGCLTIVQRYLGHESPQMTAVYAHIHDSTLRKAIDQYLGTKVVDINGEVIQSIAPELDNNSELQWLKKKVLAETLSNGYCGLPAQLTCSKGNACLTCSDFRTTIEYLDQHKQHLERTNQVLEIAQANGWERQIQVNQDVKHSLEKIIATLEENRDG
jgi:hypothetical protein